MEITHIDHAAIYVSNIDRTLKWYHDKLGFHIAYKGDIGGGDFGAFLDIGDTILAVFLNLDPNRDLSQQHIAFSVDDVDEISELLKLRGVELDFYPPVNLPEGYIRGQRYVDFRDPDGIRLELVERSPVYYEERKKVFCVRLQKVIKESI